MLIHNLSVAYIYTLYCFILFIFAHQTLGCMSPDYSWTSLCFRSLYFCCYSHWPYPNSPMTKIVTQGWSPKAFTLAQSMTPCLDHLLSWDKLNWWLKSPALTDSHFSTQIKLSLQFYLLRILVFVLLYFSPQCIVPNSLTLHPPLILPKYQVRVSWKLYWTAGPPISPLWTHDYMHM